MKILGYLSPRDLCSIAQVNHTLAQATSDGLLWQHLHPIRWFHGHWKFFKPPKSDKGDCSDGFEDSMLCARAGSPVSDGCSAQYRGGCDVCCVPCVVCSVAVCCVWCTVKVRYTGLLANKRWLADMWCVLCVLLVWW